MISSPSDRLLRVASLLAADCVRSSAPGAHSTCSPAASSVLVDYSTRAWLDSSVAPANRKDDTTPTVKTDKILKTDIASSLVGLL